LLLADGNTCVALARIDSLEARLRAEQRITLDTDLLDFLLLTGLSCWTPAYESSSRPDLQAEAYAKYKHRRATATLKNQERRITHAIENVYRDGVRTLGDFKEYLAVTRMPEDFGCKSMATLNEMLGGYGIEPFAVRARYGQSPGMLERYRIPRAR
jgi:hypothetical protein